MSIANEEELIVNADQIRYIKELSMYEYMPQVLENYNETAILLNAADVAAKYYEERKDDILLDTIINLPDHYRYSIDFGTQYHKEELIRKYRSDSIRKLSSDFLIRTVAIIDAYIEDIYHYLLEQYPEVNQPKEFDTKNPFRNDSFRRLTQRLGIVQQPSGKLSTISTSMDRYEEFRLLRHVILHNRGLVDEKYLRKFEELRSREPNQLSILDLELVDENGRLKLDHRLIYYVRKWAYAFIPFMSLCFEESKTDDPSKSV